MTLDLLRERGTPLDRQGFTWRELVQPPFSKLDDDAFTRVRVILMNGVESESIRFGHACARMNRDLQRVLADVRRVEQHQQTLVNWLNPPDQDPLETTIGFEQVAIEVTAAVAQREPDEYLAQVYRFGLLEDFDHLYRFSALMDRLQGKDANAILQAYTDVLPGRPTMVEHRAPEDDLRDPYNRHDAQLLTKLHATLIMAAEHQVHDYYMTIGPMFSDPLARALYAEIASIEEQHTTQYESISDPDESWLEKWLLHEATEVYCYYSCMQSESNPRLRKLWERFVDYELGHLHVAIDAFERFERRDAAEVLAGDLPRPLELASQRGFIRSVLDTEVPFRAVGDRFVRDPREESAATRAYRNRVNRDGSPSQIITGGYIWTPGTELADQARQVSP